MKNKEIIIHATINSLEIDLFAEYWKVNPKKFGEWTDHLKKLGIYSKIAYLLSKWITDRNDENFNKIYKEISELISIKHFIGMKREQSAFTFLKNKDYKQIIRARDLKRKYDVNWKIDLLAISKEGEKCAFQVKGPEAYKFNNEIKFNLFMEMSKIEKEFPQDKYFLIIVPEPKSGDKINLNKLDDEKWTEIKF